MRSAVIEIRGLAVFAHHGVHPEEREQGHTFVIDVWLECAPSRADEPTCSNRAAHQLR